MYLSVKQSNSLDSIIKSNEVALRSFISETLIISYPTVNDFNHVLKSINLSSHTIYSSKFNMKLNSFIKNTNKIYTQLIDCNCSLNNHTYDNSVPFVSDIIDLMYIFFNNHFSNHPLISKFSSIEEFHYCCSLYHKLRNNFSHPASQPTLEDESKKVLFFIENIINTFNDKYFWYDNKINIREKIKEFKSLFSDKTIIYNNLSQALSTHKSLISREDIITNLYNSLLGTDNRTRLAGSLVLYGYGGVGKTAITTEFLYRLLKDQKDNKFLDIEYILFFSSKDEYLKKKQTSGEFYIEETKQDFSTFDELIKLISQELKLTSIQELDKDKRGMIVIDNIENIEEIEKEKILSFIQTVPRRIQFILTSRKEERSDEKIHVNEFKNDELGIAFVLKLIENENMIFELTIEQVKELLNASKGNALIIVQVLHSLNQNTSSFDEILQKLNSMKSKTSEMIANFMYKNTFDNILTALSKKGYQIEKVMQILSLYDEKIDLYSIHKLTKINIVTAEEICHNLLERLILIKNGEYYELNEFAKRFIFTKLLPDHYQTSVLKDEINVHKETMAKRLDELSKAENDNVTFSGIIQEWQPKNYIDKIIIAELFSLYGRTIRDLRDKNNFNKNLQAFEEFFYISNHPYIPLQKARLLKEILKNSTVDRNKTLDEIERLYEQAIDSIEYDYMYLIGSTPHASLLMYFGAFLLQKRKTFSVAVRILENAVAYHKKYTKGWFISCNYLSTALKELFEETKNEHYRTQCRKIYDEVCSNQKSLHFDISRYEKSFKIFLSK